jgi:hypothetical protein
MKRLLAVGLLLGVTVVVLAAPAHAQRVRKDLLEKSHWYVAPREYQIIDDRPVIRDFREAPEAAGTVDLPPGPGMPAGGGGGGGAGALAGGGPGSTPTAAETQLGGPNPGFRNAPASMRSLPKAMLGRPENSNMRSLKTPAANLPGGFNTGVLGKLMNQQKGVPMGAQGAPRAMGGPPAGRSAGHSAAAPVASYSGGYGSGSGSGYGGSSGRTETSVRGHLLKH